MERTMFKMRIKKQMGYAAIAVLLICPTHAPAQTPNQVKTAAQVSADAGILANLVRDKVSFYKSIEAKGETWGVLVSRKSGNTDRMEIHSLKKNTPLCAYTAPSMFFTFMNAEEVTLKGYERSLLVTSWAQGAHGETLRIFDPSLKEKALLHEVTSSWPVDFTVDGDHLTIYLTEGAEPEAKPSDKTIEWKPSKE
jgi:hypothetical protein